MMNKTAIPNHRTKMKIIDRFIDALVERSTFLMVGHADPDEDCVASMVTFALLVEKTWHTPSILLGEENWKKFPYLLKICEHNSIRVIAESGNIGEDFDTVVVLDTPKVAMLDHAEALAPLMAREDVLVMEIDHHLEADGQYMGQPGYRLVDDASSTCELIGYLAVRFAAKKPLLRRFGITDLFTRNLVLSLITGMVGDAHMGQFFSSRRRKRHFRYFSRMLDRHLGAKTNRNSDNLSSIEDVVNELEELTGEEKKCRKALMAGAQQNGPLAFVALNTDQSEDMLRKFDLEVVVTVAKYVADQLAEESRHVGLVAYFDHPSHSNFVQLRMRRSQFYKGVDLRKVIDRLGIENGGGHEGAVGFRVPRNQVTNFPVFIEKIISQTVEMIQMA